MTITKQILTIAIMLALPFATRADYTYSYVHAPAKVADGGTVSIAVQPGPYQTKTPDKDDDKHIASTKYVIGAYNDAIVAVNKVDKEKQNHLVLDDEYDGAGYMSSDVMGSDYLLYALTTGEVEDMEFETHLINTKAVAKGILNQRVTIYTTWEDDTANGTALVPLTTVTQD